MNFAGSLVDALRSFRTENNFSALIFVALAAVENPHIGAANLDDLVENQRVLPGDVDVTPVLWDRAIRAHRFRGRHFRRGKEEGVGF